MLSCVCDSGLSKCEVVDTKYYTRRVPRTVYETKYTAVRTLALRSSGSCCSSCSSPRPTRTDYARMRLGRSCPGSA